MWYAAHAVMYYGYKDGNQDGYHGYENVYAIQASSVSEAFTAAEQVAKGYETDSDGTPRIGDRPATLRFAGIRKVVECFTSKTGADIQMGDELTYSEFYVPSERLLKKFVDGNRLKVIIE